MATKICHQCRSEADVLAKVCPSCKAKLGAPGKDGVAKKPTHGCVLILAVIGGFGILGAIIGPATQGNTQSQSRAVVPPEPVDPKYGPKPDISIMTIALRDQLRSGLHDPDSLDGPDLSNPVKDTITIKGKKVGCWRVGVSFRAKNGFGALRLNQGTIWMKDGNSIKTSM